MLIIIATVEHLLSMSLKQEFFVKQFFKPTVWKCFVICEILPHGA